MHDASDHINREVIKLIQQKEHLQEVFMKAMDELTEAETKMSLARQVLLKALPELSQLHIRLKELEFSLKYDEVFASTPELDLPPEYLKMSLWGKIQYHFGNDDQKQTAPEILSKILEAEPSAIRSDEDVRRKLTINLYTTLNNKYKLSEINREKLNGEFFYSLPRKESVGSN
jgi:hypothetical protein